MLAGNALRSADERAMDLAWRLASDRTDERSLVIVDVDEKSLQAIGPWPWPRATQARLMDSLATLGAGQQVYDIVFAQPRAGDDELAQAIARHQPVLAQVFALEQGEKTTSGRLSGALSWPGCPAPFGEAVGYVANTPDLATVARYAGHITPRVASDGGLRHLPAVICEAGASYPALALAALRAANPGAQFSLRRGSAWLDADWQLDFPALAQGGIPLDVRGDLRVSWRKHPSSFVSLSAADVLAGRVPSGLLQGAWVLVGSTAFGLHDTVATPYGGAEAGLQVHAQVITAILEGRMPYRPRLVPWVQAGSVVLAALLLIGLARGRAPAYLLPLAALLSAGLLWLPYAWALTSLSLSLGWVWPALFIVLLGLSLGGVEHARSRLQGDRLYRHLSSYLPAPVAAALAQQAPSSAITASEQRVCVLVADIRNFSAYVENRPADESAAVLHTFFSIATRIVESFDGVVESFQGDAILAVWSDDRADRAHQALRAAVALQHEVQLALPDPAPAALEPLALGVGLECGLATVGSFGPKNRRTHLVMGRTVTVAVRLVELSGELAHPILVGEGLAAQLGAGAGLESMGTFMLEGLRVPQHIYACPLTAAPALAHADRGAVQGAGSGV